MIESYMIFADPAPQRYTLLLALAIVIPWIAWVLHAPQGKRGVIMDAALAMFIGGVILARVEHVGLHWEGYFAYHTDEIWRISAGGLGWHGAVIGALIGLALVCHWRKLSFATISVHLSPTLGLIAWASWQGCWMAICAYGAEVPKLTSYPPWLVWEAIDVYEVLAPRFQTQPLGSFLAALFLIWVLMMRPRHLWRDLCVWSMVMFSIGFLRGDAVPFWFGLRADQVLDALFIGMFGSLWILSVYRARYRIDARG